MKISYAITVCTELAEIERLLKVLRSYLKVEDEIVILYDKKGHKGVENYLDDQKDIVLEKDFFDNHFGNWKNKLTSLCSGDYIFNLDADEYPNKMLLSMLTSTLATNLDTDVFLIPRINTVEGITEDYIKKWNWKVNEKGWINYPDYQKRIYRNNYPVIKWEGRVHEQLTGYKKYSAFPLVEELSLYHPKNIEKQISQNTFYETL